MNNSNRVANAIGHACFYTFASMFRKYPILTALVAGYYLLFVASIASLVWGKADTPQTGNTCGTGYVAIFVLQLMVMLILALTVLVALVKVPRECRIFLLWMLAAVVLPNIVFTVIVMWGGE